MLTSSVEKCGPQSWNLFSRHSFRVARAVSATCTQGKIALETTKPHHPSPPGAWPPGPAPPHPAQQSASPSPWWCFSGGGVVVEEVEGMGV